jgi:hypothetical protein
MEVTLVNKAAVFGKTGSLEIKQAVVNAASAGDNVIVAAVTGMVVRLISQSWSTATDVTVGWRSGVSGTATVIIPPRTFKAGGGMDGNWYPGFYCKTVSGEALNMYLGGSVQVSGTVNYIEVPA